MCSDETVKLNLKPIRSVQYFPTLRAVFALVLREMSSTYGRTPGGYIWAVASPAAGVAVLSAIFSLGFRNPPIGNNFALFYATGFLPFTTFTFVAGILASSINYSKSLLAYPSVTFVDAIISRFVLNFSTRLLSSAIILLGIFLFLEPRVTIEFQRILSAIAMLGALSLGIGTFNCFVASMFPIYNTVWGIVTRPLLILSCILFLFETVPQPYRDILWYNPLVHLVGLMRSAFYPGYNAQYIDFTYVYGISLAAGLTGLVFLRRYYKFILFN